MDELTHRLAVLGQSVQRDLAGDRGDLMLAEIHRRHKRRRAARAGAVATVIVAGLAAAAVFIPPMLIDAPTDAPQPQLAVQTTAPPATAVTLTLGDGSTATALTPDTAFELLTHSDEVIAIELIKGEGRFEVTPSETRVVRVVSGGVAVEVLGTQFRVKKDERGVGVDVSRGKVKVRWAKREKILTKGQDAWLDHDETDKEAPPLEAPTPPDPEEPTEAKANDAPEPKPTIQNDKAPTPEAGWRPLAKEGKYKDAYEILSKAPPSAVRDVPGELFLAADVARLSGHPGKAVTYLQRVVTRHRGDRRASQAAFTLGRVYLYNLGQPAKAARYFADVQKLGGGPLAEDALSREVEALARSGQTSRARAAAERYLARYPSGRRAATVKKLTGLE